MKYLTTIILFGIFCFTNSFGLTIRVPTDEPTIQAGIDTAQEGDTVLVVENYLTGPGNRGIDFNGKAILVMSQSGPESTVIDCQHADRGFYFHNGETSESELRGFKILNGYHLFAGAGILCEEASPAIRNCIISTCITEKYAGGIGCFRSNALIENCSFEYNQSHLNGGGLFSFCSEVVLNNCIFKKNFSHQGAGVFVDGIPSPVISNCIFKQNVAQFGGGIALFVTAPEILNCTFFENMSYEGGALHIYLFSAPILKNCILWENFPEEIYKIPFSNVEVSYSNVKNGWTGSGNIDNDPKFVDSKGFECLLMPNSPCVDTGDPTIEDKLYEKHPAWPSGSQTKPVPTWALMAVRETISG